MGQPGDPADATPFEDVDVEKDVTADVRAPQGETLTDEEAADIASQVEQIEAANQGRGAGEQVSVAPEDVS